MTTTTESTESRPAEAIGRIGKHGGWMVAFGILTTAAGICALLWPSITLLAASIVLGVQLIMAGMYRLVAAFAAPLESAGTLVMLGMLGVLQTALALRLRAVTDSACRLGRDAARSHVTTPWVPLGAM